MASPGAPGASVTVPTAALTEFFARQKKDMQREVDRLVDAEIQRQKQRGPASPPACSPTGAGTVTLPKAALERFFRQQKAALQTAPPLAAATAGYEPAVVKDSLRQQEVIKAEMDKIVEAELRPPPPALQDLVAQEMQQHWQAQKESMAAEVERLVQAELGYQRRVADESTPTNQPIDSATLQAFLKERKEEMNERVGALDAALGAEQQRRLAAEKALLDAQEDVQQTRRQQHRQEQYVRELKAEVDHLTRATTRENAAAAAQTDPPPTTASRAVSTESYEELTAPFAATAVAGWQTGLGQLISSEALARECIEAECDGVVLALEQWCDAEARYIASPHPQYTAVSKRLAHFEDVMCAFGPMAKEILGVPPIALRDARAEWCDLQDVAIVKRAVAAWVASHAVDQARHNQQLKAHSDVHRLQGLLSALQPVVAAVLPKWAAPAVLSFDENNGTSHGQDETWYADANPGELQRAVMMWERGGGVVAAAATDASSAHLAVRHAISSVSTASPQSAERDVGWLETQHRTLTLAEKEMLYLRAEVEALTQAREEALRLHDESVQDLQAQLAEARAGGDAEVRRLRDDVVTLGAAHAANELQLRTLEKDRVLMVEEHRQEVMDITAYHARVTRDAEDRWNARLAHLEHTSGRTVRKLQRKLDALREGIKTNAETYRAAATVGVSSIVAMTHMGSEPGASMALADALSSLGKLNAIAPSTLRGAPCSSGSVAERQGGGEERFHVIEPPVALSRNASSLATMKTADDDGVDGAASCHTVMIDAAGDAAREEEANALAASPPSSFVSLGKRTRVGAVGSDVVSEARDGDDVPDWVSQRVLSAVHSLASTPRSAPLHAPAESIASHPTPDPITLSTPGSLCRCPDAVTPEDECVGAVSYAATHQHILHIPSASCADRHTPLPSPCEQHGAREVQELD
eukprot:TRINITY_DN22014_c0_g1_i1.p1 TRINITY_DN22014_c0_g1~~TRINITY_DN22014_c0_g1_i1.p1  ORF type:complete len:985 (+),score=199.08 TRINITY_DN22014_c0_g1_i1:173-2956(+)